MLSRSLTRRAISPSPLIGLRGMAANPVPEPEQDQDLPLAPDHVECGLDRAVVVWSFLHRFGGHSYPGVCMPLISAYLFQNWVHLTIPEAGRHGYPTGKEVPHVNST